MSLVSKKSSVILDEVKLYMRPLVAIKTVAHQNKLKVEGNNILVSILDSDVSFARFSETNKRRNKSILVDDYWFGMGEYV